MACLDLSYELDSVV